MQVIPALDLRGGRVVRLLKGDFAAETAYPDDPVERARHYAAEGARRLHVVDLDAAAGHGSNRGVVERILAEVEIEVQVAGGIRDEVDVAGWLAAGAAAVVMGTTAVRHPELVRLCAARFPERVLAALDVKDGRPAVTGWTRTEERALPELLAAWEAAPLGAVILTCVDRDGTLTGPDLDVLHRVLVATRHPVVYSGGIAFAGDLTRLAGAGAAGAILGRSLLEGRFTLKEAIAACAS